MKTLPLDDLLQQWQSEQLTPETTIAHLIQNVIEHHQALDAANILRFTPKPEIDENDTTKIKQAIPLRTLRNLWQFESFSTEATIGHILYNLINMQIDLKSLEIKSLEAKVAALQKENDRLLAHIGLNPKTD